MTALVSPEFPNSEDGELDSHGALPLEGSWAVLSDVHTHVWLPEHLSDEFKADMVRAWPAGERWAADYDAHWQHAQMARRTVVLAFDAPYCGFVVPNEFVAKYVQRDDKRLIGFCSVDPTRPDALTRLTHAVEDLGLKGVKLAPTYQGYDPLSVEALQLFEAIVERGLPTLWHQGITFVRKSVVAYALPRLVDEVAIRFPEMPIVVAHMGHPWIDECIGVIRKHPNVYADVSSLSARPLQFREALTRAGEYGCAHKLLFGSDFPFASIGATVELLKGWTADSGLPQVLRDVCRTILTSDAVSVLSV